MYTKSHFGVLLSKPAVKDLFFTLKPGKRRKVIHKIGDPKINSASQKVTMKACVRTKHIRHPHLVTFHTRYQQSIAQIKDQVILRFLCFNTVLNEILLIFCIMEASGSLNPRTPVTVSYRPFSRKFIYRGTREMVVSILEYHSCFFSLCHFV